MGKSCPGIPTSPLALAQTCTVFYSGTLHGIQPAKCVSPVPLPRTGYQTKKSREMRLRFESGEAHGPVSRVLYPEKKRDGDHLSSLPMSIGTRESGTALPPWSSSQPGDEPGARGPSIWPCSRWGLTAAASPQTAGRSYRPISPLPRCRRRRGGMFLCHFPSSAPDWSLAKAWGLPSTLPGGARTFLPDDRCRP